MGGERTKGGVVITNFWSTVFEQLRKEDHSDDSKWIEEIRGGAHQVAAPQLSNSFSFFNFHQKFPRCCNTIFSVFGFFPNWISRSTSYPFDWIEEPVLWNKSHWLISLFVFQYYFFAKSDLDLSIDFFSYFLPNIMFYPIITTLDGGGGQGRNKQKTDTSRYWRGSQLTSEIGEGAR